MTKHQPSAPGPLFVDNSSTKSQTVTVSEVVDSARSGVSIDHAQAPEQPAAEPNQPAPVKTVDSPPDKRGPLPFYPTNADEMWRYAMNLSRSDALPRALRNKDDGGRVLPGGRVADIFLVLMKGHDFGWKPMVSISLINIIEGKAEIGALAMVALVLKSGLCAGWKMTKSDDRSAIFATKRMGDDEWTSFEYTIEEADQMGLLDKGKSDYARENNPWKKQPRTMLRRRCQSAFLREVYPDIVMGLYDHEELTEMWETRAREARMGIDSDKVIQVDQNALALSAPPTPGPIAELVKNAERQPEKVADPLKSRLSAKTNAAGVARRCSICSCTLDPRDGDPCIACQP